jgi:hypothetical protein
MPKLAYFDIQIDRAAQGYRAQVLQSPAGQASHSFALPFSDAELADLLQHFGTTDVNPSATDRPPREIIKEFGQRLFKTVFDDAVQVCLGTSITKVRDKGTRLLVRLRLNDAPDLIDLPWEYLCDPVAERFLALDRMTPLVRFLEMPNDPRPLDVTPPLRILVLISGPNDYPQLDVEREWDALRQAMADLEQQGLVVLERLDQATFSMLQSRLQQGTYHILHYIGHAGFDDATHEGQLILEEDSGQSCLVSGEDLGNLLHNHWSLRLVVLNACEGARTGRASPFAGVAQHLVRQDIPAVIGMQSLISDEAASTFASEFYKAIANGMPADVALTEARIAIHFRRKGLEWGTPVLYLRNEDGSIFKVKPKPRGPVVLSDEAPPPVPTPPADQPASEEQFLYIGQALTADEFTSYVQSFDFGVIPPDFVVLHHTAIPGTQYAHMSTGSIWDDGEEGFDEAAIKQHRKGQLDGIKQYFMHLGWDRGPHLYIDDRYIWLFTPMSEPGIHAKEGNMYHDDQGQLHYSIGLEVLGYYEHVTWPAPVEQLVGHAVAVLKQRLGTFDLVYTPRAKGISSHRDYGKPSCPGAAITEEYYIRVLQEGWERLQHEIAPINA